MYLSLKQPVYCSWCNQNWCLPTFSLCPVVGDKESETGTVSVRCRGGKQLGRRPTEEVLTSLTRLRDTRSNLDEFWWKSPGPKLEMRHWCNQCLFYVSKLLYFGFVWREITFFNKSILKNLWLIWYQHDTTPAAICLPTPINRRSSRLRMSVSWCQNRNQAYLLKDWNKGRMRRGFD